MKTLTPYLFFGGRCEEALRFYAEALGARVKTMQRFGEVMKVSPEMAGRVVHAELEVGGAALFLSDGMPGDPPASGEQIHLALGLDDLREQDRVWAALADGGRVNKELHETFFGSRMGALTDRYGIGWMVNCDLKR